MTTIIARPYVFIFLIAFLILSIRKWGLAKSLLWLISGYFIAWFSEYSSIHNGFPYGEYHYIYENLKGELMLAGVPFFDSLSYSFLTFAGYSTADFLLSKSSSKLKTLKLILLGALLTMLLDVIIDPVATMGERWFLGKIHFYAHPGLYFGVPATNFVGWFLVALTIISFNFIIWKIFPNVFVKEPIKKSEWIYPAFYIGIALFNIGISLWLREYQLAGNGISILSGIFITAAIYQFRLKSSCSHNRQV